MRRFLSVVSPLAVGLLAATPSLSPAQTNVSASWSYSFLSAGVGVGGIVVTQTGSGPEILTTRFAAAEPYWENNVWVALHPDGSGGYSPSFASEIYPSSIVRLLVGNFAGDFRDEVVILLETGQVLLYDLSSKQKVGNFAVAFADTIQGADLADLDGDGREELLVVSQSELKTYDGAGSLLWQASPGGYDVVGGQMDDDIAIEIAVTSGNVFDSATHSAQWTWPDGFGYRLEAADFDDDGRDELVAADSWYLVWAYDVERQLPRWSIVTSHDVGAIDMADTNCDGELEVLVGDGQWGEIRGFDPITQAELWSIPNPEHGTTNLAAGDTDADGQREVVWGAGWSHSGKDILYVGSPAAETLEWQSLDLTQSPIGPAVGDLDGDGHEELVAIAGGSDSGYRGGRILVWDAETLELRAVSDEINSSFNPVLDFRLHQMDGSAGLEIVLAGTQYNGGPLQTWKFDGDTETFSRVWSSSTQHSPNVSAIEVADIDLDGDSEILTGTTGFPTFVYVFSSTTGVPEWNTFQLGAGGGTIDAVLALTAGVGNPEFAALRRDGSVYLFDGVTHDALQIVPGPFSALGSLPSNVRGFYVGRNDGTATRYEKGPAGYSAVATGTVGPGRVDGISQLPDGRIAAGSAGRLRVSPALGAPATWSSIDYGPGTGRRVVPGVGAGSGLLTAGSTALHRLAPSTPIDEVSPTSGPAPGGTRVTALDPGIQAGALLYVGGSPAGGVIAVNGEASGDVPALAPGTVHEVLVVNADMTLLRAPNAWLADFLDIPAGHGLYEFVSSIARAAVTAGCGAGNYCPAASVTRAQMAVFLLRAQFGNSFAPPEATGSRFLDVACGDFAAAWIEQLAALGITAGCGGGLYCPASAVPREQMAVFLLRTLEGPLYSPSPAQGDFGDVPVSSVYAPWIEEIADRGITAGCGGGNFCPTVAVTRGQMAVFLQITFGL